MKDFFFCVCVYSLRESQGRLLQLGVGEGGGIMPFESQNIMQVVYIQLDLKMGLQKEV
uniref:Uncharacterized protein n=1 Tax=Nelumbo nucifera TaxID=4432 RepID=A0A822YWP3_NELNU|nr:TPA_asm: hypothetical protein HUJ06_012489 [Nelumbo nucifera]